MSKYALITGGNGGIGFDIAKHFAKDRINIILIGRDKNKLKSCKTSLETEFGIKVDVLSQDLSIQDSAEQIFEFVQNKGISISYLINNAGVGIDGNFADQKIEDIQELINVHALSLTKLTRLFIPQLSKNKGHILNVSSVAAFQPLPGFNVYSALKTFIYNFTLALRKELKSQEIKVTVLCPPPTRTQFFKRDKMSVFDGNFLSYSSEFVARRAYYGMKNNKAVVIPGIFYWIYTTIVAKFIPWRVIY